MDLDRFLALHLAQWRRLDELARRANSRRGRLEPGEVAELVNGHQRAATHLSYLRTHHHAPAVEAELEAIVAASHAAMSRPARVGAAAALAQLAGHTFPAAVWHHRRLVLVAAAATLVPAAILAIWLAVSDRALQASGPEALRAAYVAEDFEAYYSSSPAGQFATEVFVNNIQVAFLAFAVGVALGVPTLALLAFNGANVGMAAGLFHAAGEWPRFYGLILPHGLLELSAVFVAGAAGLALGRAVIVPGDRTRAEALAREGRRSISIVLGLVAVFALAGLIEAFVTPSSIPTAGRVGIGVAAWAGFVAYVAVLGTRAQRRGLTGLLGETAHDDQADQVLTAPSI